MAEPAGPSIVTAFATLNEGLLRFMAVLRENSAVKAVTSAFSPRSYRAGPRIECYVDAELTSGNAVAWWLEFRWEMDKWTIESSVRHNTTVGEDELVGLPTRHASEDAQFTVELEAAWTVLRHTIDRLDLSVL